MLRRLNWPQGALAGFLFGLAASIAFAETTSSAGEDLGVVQCGSLSLVRRGNPRLGELIRMRGDSLELRKLAGDLAGAPFSQFDDDPFTVWTDAKSEVRIALPYGLRPEPGPDHCMVHTGVPNIDYVIAFGPLPFDPLSAEWELAASRQAWLAVHRAVVVADEPMFVRDTRFSAGRHFENGGIVDRHMTTGRGREGKRVQVFRNDVTGRSTFASLAVVNRDAGGIRPAEMTEPDRLAWARGVLAANLTAVPPFPGGPTGSGGSPASDASATDPLWPGERPYPRIRCGEASLIPLSQPRRLSELAGGDPPPDDLDAVLRELAGTRTAEIAEARFDLWVEPSKGAVVPLPHALMPTADQRDCRVPASLSPISFIARVFKGSSEDISVADWRYRTGSEVRAFARELATAAGISATIDPASRFHATVPPNGEVGGYRMTGTRPSGANVLISLVGLRRDRVLTLFAMIDADVKPADALSPADRTALALGLAAVRLATLLPPTGFLTAPEH